MNTISSTSKEGSADYAITAETVEVSEDQVGQEAIKEVVGLVELVVVRNVDTMEAEALEVIRMEADLEGPEVPFKVDLTVKEDLVAREASDSQKNK
jgi:hypothetical protein